MKEIVKKWLQFAKADLEAAEVLLKSGKTHWSYQLCVLHCHQAVEKILKTVIISKGKEHKRTHDLIVLAKDAKVELPKQFQEYLDELNPHYHPGRYPDINYKGPIFKYNQETAQYHFNKTKEVFFWLTKKII